MSIVITVSGLHGTGKTTIAKKLANKLDLRHISAGGLFRQLAEEKGLSLEDMSEKASQKNDLDRLVDARTKEEARKGSVILDGLISGWMAGEDADLKFYLFAPEDVRISRIARRDKCYLEEAKKATLFREELERRRFKKFYAIDIDNYSIYDIVLNTALLSPNGNTRILECFARTYIEEKGVK